MINEKRLLDTFRQLVSIDSESFHEGAMRDELTERLTALGLTVTEDGAAEALRSFGAEAGNLHAVLAGTRPGAPLLFSAHMDTVSPGKGKRAVLHPDGSIRSDGRTVLGADDAAGLACLLEALAIIQERRLPHPELELLLTAAEEPYGKGSALIDYSAVRAESAYVLDLTGPVGTAAIQAPSILSVEITVSGRAAHAGFAPESGVNALSIAAAALSRLETGRVSADTTVNFGTIRGGAGRNIVPETVRIQGEIRSLRHEEALRQGRRMEAVFQDAAEALGGRAAVKITEEIRAFRVDEEEAVVRRFQAALKALDLGPARLITTFGGSDNNNFARHGIRGIVLACAMNDVHSVHESSSVEELKKAAALTLRLMTMEDD